MDTYIKVLHKLADGRFHSGEELARDLGISRAAVWKQLQKISAMSLAVDAVRGRGYRLQEPLDLLDRDVILKAMSDDWPGQVEIHHQLESTNQHLMEQIHNPEYGSAHTCLAEMQTHGRGRRGRQWVSPLASNLYLSMLWRYRQGPMALSGLSLALGLAVIRVLKTYIGEGLGLKWPNDIYWQDNKLAGILVEISGEANGPCHVVAGLGLNVQMPDAGGRQIDQAWVDLKQILADDRPTRNQLAAELIESFTNILQSYPQQGFGHYQQEWIEHDVMQGRQVCLSFPNAQKHGIVRGVDQDGALLFEQDGQIEVINAGEISLRVQS